MCACNSTIVVVPLSCKRCHLCIHAYAKEMFDSFQLAFNVRSNAHRNGNNADLAAEEGPACITVHLFVYHI